MPIESDSLNNYILVVDDNPDNLLLIKLILERDGHQVHLVDNALTALDIVAHSPPNLIVLDVMMPFVDGYEMTRRIRQDFNLPFIPILLVTAHSESSLVKGLDGGADEFLRKPLQIDEIQARVRSLLRLKQTIDQRDNFVSCLTHDLRTPIVAANRMLTLLSQGVYGEATPAMKAALDNVMLSNDNLLEMLNNLLEVHCYEVGEKFLNLTNFNLQQLLEEIITQLLPLAQEKDLQLSFNSQGNLREIKGDRLELRRVFTNLINNAIQYTDRGSIEVSFAPTHLNHWLIITIQDTGIGIAPEIQSGIFKRFRQGNHDRAGKGLGLYLCSQIVQAHRGFIEVESQQNQGSVFTVRLPLS